MRLAARVARSCCCALHRQQQRCRGGGGGTNCNAAAVAVVAQALTFSQPLPRGGARSHRISSLRRLEAVLERPVMTSCRSGSGDQSSSSNRGGIAESSSSPSDDAAAAAAADAVDDDDNKPLVSPPPQNDNNNNNKRTRRMRLDEAASLAAGSSVSRTVIQSWIARGKVFVDGVPVTKAGHPVPPRAAVEVRASEERFVCRGGLKLDAALSSFGIDVRGMRAIDCGLSTGGFADRLLQGGVEAVLGVDVGYGQVAERVRTDPRLFSLERTNARRLTAAMLPRGAPRSYDIATLDVSFISVLKILPAISSLLEDSAHLVVLVKPQFEAGKASVGAGGVVRSEAVRREVLASVVAAVPEAARFSVSFPFEEGGEEENEGAVVAAAADASASTSSSKPPLPPRFVLQGTMESPIRGATSGNVEYLAHFKRGK